MKTLNPWLQRIFIALFTMVMLAGCSDSKSPEELLNITIDEIQKAAEAKNTGDVMAFISENYQDPKGRTREDVRSVLRIQFLRYTKIYTYKLVTKLKFSADKSKAIVTVFAATAGKPIPDLESLKKVRADVIRFDVDFHFDDEWKIVSSTWRPASPADLAL